LKPTIDTKEARYSVKQVSNLHDANQFHHGNDCKYQLTKNQSAMIKVPIRSGMKQQHFSKAKPILTLFFFFLGDNEKKEGGN